MDEFSLITQYFARLPSPRHDVLLGIGDDAAIMDFPAGHQLVTATDTLVAGKHFFLDANPADVAHKALAVNLSDFAAMNATPAWLTLAITLPHADDAWLSAFCDGLRPLMRQFNLALVGGDTTRGPLTITFQVSGYAKPDAFFRRDQARVGQGIYVTGSLGGAAAALRCMTQDRECSAALTQSLHRPTPRLAVAQALTGLVHCAIDVSDGLLADLQHVLDASGVGATLTLPALPVHPDIAGIFSEQVSRQCVLYGGDDYELIFTCDESPDTAARLHVIAQNTGCPITRIGVITAATRLRGEDDTGKEALLTPIGYNHFT